MKELEDDNGNKSSIRKALLVAMIIDVWLVALMSASIILDLIRGNVIDWTGLSYYMAAIAAVTSGVAWAKAHQKKYENNGNTNEIKEGEVYENK